MSRGRFVYRWVVPTDPSLTAATAPTPYVLARRTDREGAERLRGRRNVEVVSRADGTLLALFTSPYHLEAAQRDLEGIVLDPILTT